MNENVKKISFLRDGYKKIILTMDFGFVFFMIMYPILVYIRGNNADLMGFVKYILPLKTIVAIVLIITNVIIFKMNQDDIDDYMTRVGRASKLMVVLLLFVGSYTSFPPDKIGSIYHINSILTVGYYVLLCYLIYKIWDRGSILKEFYAEQEETSENFSIKENLRPLKLYLGICIGLSIILATTNLATYIGNVKAQGM